MKLITQRHLSRRKLLRGIGAAIALPGLESMTPAAKSALRPPNRMVFVYVPNGVIMDAWTPAKTGKDYELPRILKPLQAHRQKLMLLTGLAHKNGRSQGEGGGDHARASATFLTGVHPKKTSGADISLGPSVDQVAAQAIGKRTRFPSLELCLEEGRVAGKCDSGFSCAYVHNISWRSPTTPNPPEVNPRLVFERLFGDFDPTESEQARQQRLLQNKSILDFVVEDVRDLMRDLGRNDRPKLDEYLGSIREIEDRLTQSEKWNIANPDIDRPMGVPASYSEHARIMFDLLTLAMQTDLTRIATFMMGREGSNIPYREIGISDGHHALTHNGNKPDMMEKLRQINTFHIELLTHFLTKMDNIRDVDGNTLLDNSMVVYGSGLSDGNLHTHHQLPVLLAGRGCGTIHSGVHSSYPDETPMTNLFLSMLDRMEVRTESLGDSTGRLATLL
jgi:hypothetical protein